MSGFHKFAGSSFGTKSKKSDPKVELELQARVKDLAKAVNTLLEKPAEERDALLAGLKQQVAESLDRLGPVRGQAGLRLERLQRVLEAVEAVARAADAHR